MERGDYLILFVLVTAWTLIILGVVSYRQALARVVRSFLASPVMTIRRVLALGLRSLVEGLVHVKAGQVAFATFVAALVFSSLHHDAARAGLPLLIAVLGFAIVLVWTWVREFLILMSLRDEDFPGRSDKLVWIFLMLVLPPVGLYLFHAYRLAHWPEPKAAVDVARELA